MLDYDTHIHAFQVDLTEQSSRDRINLAKEHWRAYVQGRAESELTRNKQAIPLSAWRAEDRALRSSRARPVVCSDCGARNLEHFYTSIRPGKVSGWRVSGEKGAAQLLGLKPTTLEARMRKLGIVRKQ